LLLLPEADHNYGMNSNACSSLRPRRHHRHRRFRVRPEALGLGNYGQSDQSQGNASASWCGRILLIAAVVILSLAFLAAVVPVLWMGHR
jgi:hypothetical protein